MSVFEYKGMTAQGKTVTGIVDADSPRMARHKLRSDGIYPTEVYLEREHKRGGLSREVSLARLFQRVRLQDVSILTRQLATLLKAGLTLVSSLNALADQIDNPRLKKVITQVRERVNEGASLADALQSFSGIFPDLYISMVRAGESSGALELVLLRLADYLENQVRIRRRIVSALVYPAVMTVVGLAVLSILFAFVIPKFVAIFAELQQALPLPTVILIKTSDFVRSYWYLILVCLAAAAHLLRRYRATPKGREVYDRALLHIPVFGRLILLGTIIRFARTLSSLLSSGVPLLKALDIVATVVNNKVFAGAIASARESVTEGASLSDPLKRSGIFPPIVIHMMASGEQSGQLEEMLSKVAEIYEEETDTLTSTLMSLLEPFLILGMALAVAFIVISILLPLLEMNQIVR
ncbi:MAG: type II secretion system inner membrane protein GspF [bacterium]